MNEKWNNESISIVIPVYNAAPYLERTLNSVKNQTFSEWELILVDDASKDASVEVIRDWLTKSGYFADKEHGCVKQAEQYGQGKITLLYSKENRGAAHARNLGVRHARGRYLVYLDADDYWESEKLEKQYAFMKKMDCAFSFTGYEFADESGIRNGKVVHIPECITYEEALVNTTISTITVMFDRNRIPAELLYMPEDCAREDTATWWKILKHGYTAYGLDEALSVYCRHRGSQSSNKLKAVLGTYQMYRKQEQLGVLQTLTCMRKYITGAIKRRL